MKTELAKAAEHIRHAETHLAEGKKKIKAESKYLDDLDEAELGLQWIAKKITRIIQDPDC